MLALRVLTYNVWTSPKVLDSLLNIPNLNNLLNIILLQEPPARISSAGAWSILLPISPSDTPQSIILINKKIDPSTYNQIPPTATQDIAAVKLRTSGKETRERDKRGKSLGEGGERRVIR
jgi:hypothetical protein